MSRQTNPTLVGIFVLTAAFLGMGTLIFVGAGKLFRAEETLITYFGESVNGLTVGAAVKFKGVPVGEVKDIRISHNQRPSKGESYIPVFLTINLSKVGEKLDQEIGVDFIDPVTFHEALRNGLRAKLQLSSFITGQLYVELDYFEEPGAPCIFWQSTDEFKEVPSVPSDMAEIGATTSDILTKFAAVNVKEINNRLLSLLGNLDKAVQQVDFEGWNTAVLDTADSVKITLEALNVEEAAPELRDTLAAFKALVDKLDLAMDPALEDYHETLAKISGTLDRGNRVLDNLENMTQVDSSMRRELMTTMKALQDAAQSAEELLSFLERNPKALLTGRSD